MKIISKIIEELYQEKQNKTYLYIGDRNRYEKIFKDKINFEGISIVVINFKKFKILEVLKIFFFLSSRFKVYKNFMIFFNLKKEIIAYNFFPDWPSYKFLSITRNLIFWIKKIIQIFINFKLISFVAIKFK
tara:strand:+ start:1640 stop:2032 length:393 start_codon:yes stop_codon:yes gene_type:complete